MTAYAGHTHLLFSLESLNNLARNGRVKLTAAVVARALGIRVLGQASPRASWTSSARPGASTACWSG